MRRGATTVSTLAHAREKARWHPISPGCKLSDDLEEQICEFISRGLSFADAGRLAGVHRSTIWNWKQKGSEYLDAPELHAGDWRFAQFVEACEEAELRGKIKLIERIAQDPDWRSAAFILKARYKVEWAEQANIRSEISGVDGQAIPVALSQQNPFQVVFSMPQAPSDEKFVTVNHQQPEQIEEPKPPAEPQPEFVNDHRISQVLDSKPDGKPDKLHPFDSLGPRTWERGLHS